MASNSVKDEKVHNSEKMTIHQREDSESELEALFSYGLNATKHKLVSIPMKQRNLPSSFFKGTFDLRSCLSNFEGPKCERCSPDHYGYPTCKGTLLAQIQMRNTKFIICIFCTL